MTPKTSWIYGTKESLERAKHSSRRVLLIEAVLVKPYLSDFNVRTAVF